MQRCGGRTDPCFGLTWRIFNLTEIRLLSFDKNLKWVNTASPFEEVHEKVAALNPNLVA